MTIIIERGPSGFPTGLIVGTMLTRHSTHKSDWSISIRIK